MTELRDKYEVVIGLEVHAQLKTKSKIFAPDSTEFGNEQNTQISPITLGMPGVLPVLNKKSLQDVNLTENNIFILTFRKVIRFLSMMSRFVLTVILM